MVGDLDELAAVVTRLEAADAPLLVHLFEVRRKLREVARAFAVLEVAMEMEIEKRSSEGEVQ